MRSERAAASTIPLRAWTLSARTQLQTRQTQLTTALARQWSARPVLLLGVAVFVLASLLGLLFHVNRPAPFIPYHDSLEYIRSANRINSGGWWVDADRLPGYPLLLAATFLLTGKDNLVVADAVQYLLFALTAVEVYILAYRVWRNLWYATVIGVLFATNFYFLSYTRPILSDGLALFLTTSLALAVIAYIQHPGVSRLWVAAGLLLALIMTRAEWYLLPVPLFAYFMFVAYRKRTMRRLLPHAVLAVLLVYAVMGLYTQLNARVNGVAGLTEIENLNLYGKVIQYQMQNEAPARYASIMRITDGYVKSQEYDPWFIVRHDPSLASDHFVMLGDYARAIIVRHPVQFVVESGRLMFRSLYVYWPFVELDPQGTLAGPLYALEHFSVIVYALFALFPFCVVGWWVALWRRRRVLLGSRIEAICVLTALIAYDLVTTTAGSYGEYPRLHLAFDPLTLIVVVGSLLLLARNLRLPAQHGLQTGLAEPAPVPRQAEMPPPDGWPHAMDTDVDTDRAAATADADYGGYTDAESDVDMRAASRDASGTHRVSA